MVQWLRLWAASAKGTSLIPRWGTKIPLAMQCRRKIKNKIKSGKIILFVKNITTLEEFLGTVLICEL